MGRSRDHRHKDRYKDRPDKDKRQPPPPELEEGAAGQPPWHGDDNDQYHGREWHVGGHHHHIDDEAAEVIYSQLREVRLTVDSLVEEMKEARLKKRLEHVPVRTSDLMRGFQSAVAKANRATLGSGEAGENIERMSIKDLEISLEAPVIDGGHAEDPVLMLPNIKSAGAETASVSMKFTVVSVPVKQRG